METPIMDTSECKPYKTVVDGAGPLHSGRYTFWPFESNLKFLFFVGMRARMVVEFDKMDRCDEWDGEGPHGVTNYHIQVTPPKESCYQWKDAAGMMRSYRTMCSEMPDGDEDGVNHPLNIWFDDDSCREPSENDP